MMGNDMNMRVVLGANISKFKSGMAQAKLTLEKTGKQMDGFLHKMGKSLPMAAAVAGAAISALVVKTAKWGDDIAKTSKQLGVTTEFLSEMDFVAQRAGANMADVSSGIGRLAKAAKDANDGLATYVRAFRDLGVETKDSNGELKETEVLFMEVVKALGDVENGTKRLALARELLGRGGGRLLPLIDEDIEGLRKLAKEMGVSLTAEDAAKFERFADSITNLQTAMKGVAVQSAPFLDAVADMITALSTRDGGRLIEYLKLSLHKGVGAAFPTSGFGLGSYMGERAAGGQSPLPRSNLPVKVPRSMGTGDISFPDGGGAVFPPQIAKEDLSGLPHNLKQVQDGMEGIGDSVIRVSESFGKWERQADKATGYSMNAIGDVWSELKAGEGVFASLGEAAKRFVEDFLFDMARAKIGASFLGFFTSSGASTGPNIDWPMDVSSSSGNVTVNLTNSSGLPMDVTSSNVSTGLNGQTQIDLMINSSLSRQASSGRLDPLMRLYGARRQGVSR